MLCEKHNLEMKPLFTSYYCELCSPESSVPKVPAVVLFEPPTCQSLTLPMPSDPQLSLLDALPKTGDSITLEQMTAEYNDLMKKEDRGS